MGQQKRDSNLRRQYLPLTVAIISVAATLVLFFALRRQERAQAQRVIRLATASITSDIVSDVQTRVLGLVRIAKLWEAWGGPRKQEFELHASLYVSHNPGCVAVRWVDADFISRWTLPAGADIRFGTIDLASDREQRRALEMARDHRQVRAGHAIKSDNGDKLFPVAVPLFAGNEFQGFVLALFDFKPLMTDILSDHADLGYSVEILDGSDFLYALHGEDREFQKDWSEERIAELPGVNWRVKVWPSEQALGDVYPLSSVVLVGGLVMASLLTLTVYLARQAQRAAKHLEVANEELHREVGERRRAEESLHRLSGRLLQLQDDERRRIARELHDSTAQVLYALTMKLRLVADLAPPKDAEAKQIFSESMEMAEQCVREMRTMAYLLHPPSLDELGLVPAWRSYVRGFTERSGIRVALDVPPDLGRLPRDIETALFRIVQESLSNIHRHSGSRTACIRLVRSDGEIILEISDEGRGLPANFTQPASGDVGGLGVGIAGMRERVRQLGGRLEIESSSHGTDVRAILPRQEAAVA